MKKRPNDAMRRQRHVRARGASLLYLLLSCLRDNSESPPLAPFLNSRNASIWPIEDVRLLYINSSYTLQYLHLPEPRATLQR